MITHLTGKRLICLDKTKPLSIDKSCLNFGCCKNYVYKSKFVRSLLLCVSGDGLDHSHVDSSNRFQAQASNSAFVQFDLPETRRGWCKHLINWQGREIATLWSSWKEVKQDLTLQFSHVGAYPHPCLSWYLRSCNKVMLLQEIQQNNLFVFESALIGTIYPSQKDKYECEGLASLGTSAAGLGYNYRHCNAPDSTITLECAIHMSPN